MADKDFRIDLILGAKFSEAFRALDQAQRKIKDVDQAAGKFSKGAAVSVGSALRTTAVAGVAAATAAAAVMSLYIAKSIEAEKVQAQLASRIKDTGGIAGRTLEQLNASASKLQSMTVFDDEAIGSVQAMLLTFKELRGLQFDRATASVLDLSTAMGTDLNSAALQLGKALNDPVGGLSALSRAGVQFSDQQKEVIKKLVETGQVAKAQDLILAELESQMGSAAEAARDTLGGAVQALKNSFDNLLEGDSGDAGVKGTRDAIEALIETLNDPDVKRGVDAVVGGMFQVANAAVQVIAKVAEASGAIREYFAENDKKTSTALANKRDELEGELFAEQRAQKRNWLGAGAAKNSPRVQALKAEIAEIDALLAQRARDAKSGMAAQGVDAGFDFLLQGNGSNASRTPTGGKAPKGKKSGGSKSDPDSDIKNRIASLKEEVALLGMVEEGEDRASEAAKVRYAITEGEFKNKSPQLKAELLAAAEALDAKNKDIAAEEERKEAIEESRKAYESLRDELRTPAEVAVDSVVEQINTLNAALEKGLITAEKYQEEVAKIGSNALTPAPDFRDELYQFGIGDPDADRFAAKNKELQDWYTQQLAVINAGRAAGKQTNDYWDQQEAAAKKQHFDSLNALAIAQNQMQLLQAESIFGSMAQIARSFAGEQSKTYQVLFAISKGFAVAQLATSLAINVAKASEAGFPQNIGLIAAAMAQGAQIAQILAGANYGGGGGGYAEGGYTGAGGKYQPAGIVHKGEGVLSQEEIAKLGGPSGFYQLRELIQEGELLERQRFIGYAAGGLVGLDGPSLPQPGAGSYPKGAAAGGGVQNRMRVYMVQDREELARYIANHPANEKAVIGFAGQNGNAIRADW